MEIGTPQSLYTPNGHELTFNDFSGSPTPLFSGTPILAGLTPGSGLLIQKITGADGADIRNPTDTRPHKQGGIVHRFFESASIWTVEGLVTAMNKTDRSVLDDALRGALRQCLQHDARYFFTPSGEDMRFRTVRQYSPVDLSNTNYGEAGPRTFTFTMYSEDPHSYRATQDSTLISASGTVPNIGNVETWPVIQLQGGLAGSDVTIANADTGFELKLVGLTLAAGHDLEINCFHETMYVDGNGANKLGNLDLDLSDFFSVEAGGNVLTVVGGTITVLSNSAWI